MFNKAGYKEEFMEETHSYLHFHCFHHLKMAAAVFMTLIAILNMLFLERVHSTGPAVTKQGYYERVP